MGEVIPCPLETTGLTVEPEWIDHNGHMNVAYYLMAFDKASGDLLALVGLDRAYKQRSARTTFVGDYHVRYVRELLEGAPLRIVQRVIDCDAKRVHFHQEMYHAEMGYLAATAEALTLHVDMTSRRVTAMPAALLERVQAVREAHAGLPPAAQLARVIGVSPGAGSSAARQR